MYHIITLNIQTRDEKQQLSHIEFYMAWNINFGYTFFCGWFFCGACECSVVWRIEIDPMYQIILWEISVFVRVPHMSFIPIAFSFE